MPNGQSAEGESVSEIQVLTSRVQHLSHSVDFWNVAMLWGLLFAAVAAIVIGISTRLVVVRTGQLGDVQGQLIAAKDRQLQADLKEKDREIAVAGQNAAHANKAAGEANERAGKANERSKTLEVEALRLREQLAAQGPRENLLRGQDRQKLVDELKPFTGQRIDLRHSASVIEVNGAVAMSTPIGDDALGLAIALTGVVKDAGWESPSAPLLASVEGQGIEILVVRGASEKTMQAAIVLGHSLQAVPFEKVHGPVFADENRAQRVGKDTTSPAFDKDTIVVEVMSHP